MNKFDELLEKKSKKADFETISNKIDYDSIVAEAKPKRRIRKAVLIPVLCGAFAHVVLFAGIVYFFNKNSWFDTEIVDNGGSQGPAIDVGEKMLFSFENNNYDIGLDLNVDSETSGEVIRVLTADESKNFKEIKNRQYVAYHYLDQTDMNKIIVTNHIYYYLGNIK